MFDGLDNVTADARSGLAQTAGLWTDQSTWIATDADSTLITLNDTTGGLLHGPDDYTVTGAPLSGDMDCDVDVDFDDIDDFVLGLNDPTAYEAMFGIPPSVKGDIDGDGDQDFDDISGFVGILGGGDQAVPEPSSLLLTIIGILGLLQYRLRRS